MGKAMITIKGKKYKVVEDLGYQAGYMAKSVLVDGEEKVIVKDHGQWRFWTVEERIAPLSAYLVAREKAKRDKMKSWHSKKCVKCHHRGKYIITKKIEGICGVSVICKVSRDHPEKNNVT